ncbi:hypothetical protein B0H14DRAFT_3606553 [Mycena olivaceomarginata]|nr:hypothetical protein B0H14DRAFT_3606553 [Mycena olivaceomarginata]
MSPILVHNLPPCHPWPWSCLLFSEPDLSKEDDEDCEKDYGDGSQVRVPAAPTPLTPTQRESAHRAHLGRTTLDTSTFAPHHQRPASPVLSSPSSSSAALSPYSAASQQPHPQRPVSPVVIRAPSPYSDRDFDAESSIDSSSESEREEFYADAEGEDAATHAPYASASRPTTSPSPADLFPPPTGTAESDHGDDEEYVPSEGELRSKDTEDADADYAPAPKRLRTNSGKAVPARKAKRRARRRAKPRPPLYLSEDDVSGDATRPRTGKKNDKKKKFFCQVEGCPERGKPFTYSGMGRHRNSHQPDYRNNVCPGGCGIFLLAAGRDQEAPKGSCPGDRKAGLARLAAENGEAAVEYPVHCTVKWTLKHHQHHSGRREITPTFHKKALQQPN